MDLRRIFWLMFVFSAPAFPDARLEASDAVLGLPPTEIVGNYEKARLGKRLFFDKRLSADGAVSCGNCHMAEHSFTDRQTRAIGHRGMRGTRNAPSLFNVTYMQTLFWDGRAANLVEQARAPFVNPVEHALADETALVKIVSTDLFYAKQFSRLWPNDTSVGMKMIAEALAAYEGTLLSGGSPFDHFFYAKKTTALSDAAIRGLKLFRGRANCESCHEIGARWSLFTDHSFHMAARGLPASVSSNLPALTQRVAATKASHDQRDFERLIATEPDVAALGRFLVTLAPRDIGCVKTPSLRNVALTAPYMHDGSVSTLEEAIELELYNRGAVTYPIILTRAEKTDLLEFLRSLSGIQSSLR